VPIALSPQNEFTLTLKADQELEPGHPQRVDIVCRYLTCRQFMKLGPLIEQLSSDSSVAEKTQAGIEIIELGLERIIGGPDDAGLYDLLSFDELLELVAEFIDRQSGPSLEQKKSSELQSACSSSDSVRIARVHTA
tara:strand:+ start:1823 stop:2230 length:408 start_codon:yes stop_codon:yes gene_type:complete